MFVSTVKEDRDNQSYSCGEIDRWRTISLPFHSVFERNAHFNSTSGRFTAKEDGLYLVTANLLVRHAGSSEISMTALIDGESNNPAFKTFQPKSSNSPVDRHVSTLTLAGTVRLIKEQYLSIFLEVQCQGSNLKVLRNSSFSIVFVSRWKSDYAAGFLATTTDPGYITQDVQKVSNWKITIFSKILSVLRYTPVVIKSSGLYFLQSVLILNVDKENAIVRSGVLIDNNIALNGIFASKVSEGSIGDFVSSAFGVLYLQKGQKIRLFVGGGYQYLRGSSFSMVRFLAPGQQPGLHQILQHVRNTSMRCDEAGIQSMSTGGDQLAYIQSNMFKVNSTIQCSREEFTTALTGTYFISLMFILTGKVPRNVTACVGPQKCTKCYIEFSTTLRQHNNTFGFVGLVDFKKDELISVCLSPRDKNLSIVTAARSVQYLGELNLYGTVQLKHQSVRFNTSGWHELTDWESYSGKSLQNVYVKESGLYILSTNLELKTMVDSLVGVKLEVKGLSNLVVLSVSSSAKASFSVSLSVAVLARLNTTETITVSLYSTSDSLSTGNNSTLFAALITKNTYHPCLSLQSKTSRYSSGEWWQGIEQWVNVDAQCTSETSNIDKGRFVADVAGVYFVAASVMVRTSRKLHETR